MSVTYKAVYTKPGAIFANAQEAQADKNALYSPEFKQSINDCFDQMLLDGVLLEPVYPVWDQATFTLTIVVVVISEEAYLATNFPFVFSEVIAESSKTGWIHVRKFIS